jgi:autotransporter-associated beta strand protein
VDECSATGEWNIDTDFNWMTAVGLGHDLSAKRSGGHSVLFNESEPEASPVAINIPAAVSPNAISINNPNKNYVFSGQAISGTAALIKDGAGTATFSNTLGCTGGMTVNGGKVVVKRHAGRHHRGTPWRSPPPPAARWNTPRKRKSTREPTLYSGDGTLLKTGAGTLLYDGSNSTIAMAAGGLIDLQAGKIQFGNWNAQSCTAAANQSDMNIAGGAIFDGYAANVTVDNSPAPEPIRPDTSARVR